VGKSKVSRGAEVMRREMEDPGKGRETVKDGSTAGSSEAMRAAPAGGGGSSAGESTAAGAAGAEPRAARSLRKRRLRFLSERRCRKSSIMVRVRE
jgi:hypothetical protein